MKKSLRFSIFAASLAIAISPTYGKPVPENLGNGLDRLLESHLAVQDAEANGKNIQTFTAADGKKYTSAEVAAVASASIHDDQDRYEVRINLDGTVAGEALRDSLSQKFSSVKVNGLDSAYRGVGVMSALVSLDDMAALAQTPGVRSVILEWRPRHNSAVKISPVAPVEKPIAIANPPAPQATPGQTYNILGTYMDQGVIQHRVDYMNQFYNPAATFDYEGNNLGIACISNSFAANTAHPASLDVTNNDLPGNASNPVGNTTPVFVLQDDLTSATSDDEGRGMCQIVYKMAPKAKVGFGTADISEVNFANTIRALAGIPNADFPNAATQGFKADVVCDDVGYFDEPFYEDGIIGAGVNDVAAAGIHYFSSAANDVGVNGYESVIRVVPNDPTSSGALTFAGGNQALINTNINLTGVPANLYAGGFHNFNPNPGQQDVAQLVNVAANNTVPTVLQWNDPYDQSAGFVSQGSQIYSNTGTYVSAPIVFNGSSTPPLPQFAAGQGYQIIEKATSGNFDAIVTIIDPNGNTVLVQDTGTDETVNFVAPFSGQYQISVNHFGTTTGSFSIAVYNATITPYVKSDWNLLAFRTDTGAYVPASSLTTNNVASNEPVELGYVNRTATGTNSIQYVFARSNTPTGPNVADHIRYQIPANGRAGYGPAEYFTYNTITTAGHAMAKGCNGTAAYPAFRPSIPEGFTSPGTPVIYFDTNQNRLSTPEVRLQPGVAAMDAGNISANEGAAGLGSDSGSDFDSAANFSGTSAAAPHAAACALLIVEAHGGRGSVMPAQMMTLLHQTAFPHDLDPNASSSVARASNGGKVTLSFSSDNTANGGTGVNDVNSLAISYVGPSYITSITFNPAGAASTGGCVTCGNNGLDNSNAYFNNVYPGMVFLPSTKAFTVGGGSVGLTSADVSASFSNLAPAPSNNSNQYWTMALNFSTPNFTGGKILEFTVARGVQHSSSLSGTVAGNGATGGTTAAQYSADLFGGGVLLPEGTVMTDGMAYSGTMADGATFSGTIKNRIGSGYSKLDGFGFINAQAAAAAALP